MESTVRIDNGSLDIPVYFSICSENATSIISTKKQMGKGATPVQAEASAVMELAERYIFFSFCKNPANFIIDSYKNLEEKAMPFEMIARAVHDDSSDLAVTQSFFYDLPIQWTWAYNLTQNKEILVPFDWFFAINKFNRF